MVKEIKVGLIGGGKIVENSHLPVLKNIPEVCVSWVYDADEERSQLLSKMYLIKPVTEWEKNLKEVDVCLITIPYGVRQNYLQAVAAFSKNAYVEKPFALTEIEHTNLANSFKPYGLAIGFQRRVYRIVNELKELITSEILGKLISIDFKQGYFTLKGGGSYLGNAALSGGGVIIESAIHSLDQILLITSATDVMVNTATYIVKKGVDYDSTVQSTLFTPSGNVEVTTQISTLQNLNNGLALRFTNGIVQCKLSPDAVIKVSSHNKNFSSFYLNNINELPDKKIATTVNSSFYIFWQYFIDGIINKEQNITSASGSVITTRWIEKIYERFR